MYKVDISNVGALFLCSLVSSIFVVVGVVTKSMCQVSKNVHRALVWCVKHYRFVCGMWKENKKKHSNGIKIKVSNVRPMNDERKSICLTSVDIHENNAGADY